MHLRTISGKLCPFSEADFFEVQHKITKGQFFWSDWRIRTPLSKLVQLASKLVQLYIASWLKYQDTSFKISTASFKISAAIYS